MKFAVIKTTVDSMDCAQTIARNLVESKLAACVQISPAVRSVYVWQGQIEEAEEHQLWIKTLKHLEPALEKRLRQLHPYEVPEYWVFEPATVSEAYGDWMVEVLTGAG